MADKSLLGDYPSKPIVEQPTWRKHYGRSGGNHHDQGGRGGGRGGHGGRGGGRGRGRGGGGGGQRRAGGGLNGRGQYD